MTSLADRLIGRMSRQGLAPFQRRFLRGAFAAGVRRAALSMGRGGGKSTLCGWLLSEVLDPAGALFVAGTESVMVAGSRDQAMPMFRTMRRVLGEDAYRYQDSGQRVGARHEASNTTVRVASSDAKRAFGIESARLIIGDEPGAWQERGGAMMYDALATSAGKVQQTLVLIGTRAPGDDGGWWRNMLDEPTGDRAVYVQVHDAPVGDDGQVLRWSTMRTLARANPLIGHNPELLPALLDERATAKRSSTARRQYQTLRLNRPQQPAAEVLFVPEDWQAIEERDVPPAVGRPIVGIDVGSSRSWTAACALWPNGRCDALVIVPGVPDLAAQERRDAVRPGQYQKLLLDGVLQVDPGRKVVRPAMLINLVIERWRPRLIVGDRFAAPAVHDALRRRYRYEPRMTRWSESTADIGATRTLGLDGQLSIVPRARRAFRRRCGRR